MSENRFNFKQFTVQQNSCAMKVGTDGVLIGAWVSLEQNPLSILDIGAGTGLVSLILAQRSHSEIIDAIEIDASAYEQCIDNFEDSPWNDRLFCYHAPLEEFTKQINTKYDLIISNPPFYSNTFKSNNKQRNLARFRDALPFETLLECVSKLLSDTGRFAVIIPFKEEERFIKLASNFGLFAQKILQIKGNVKSVFIRSLIEFSFLKNDVITKQLIIENERHLYTKDYINLTKDFYLNMP